MSREDLGAIVVGTGFGILTHTRALRAAGFDVRGLVGREHGADMGPRRGSYLQRTGCRQGLTGSRRSPHSNSHLASAHECAQGAAGRSSDPPARKVSRALTAVASATAESLPL